MSKTKFIVGICSLLVLLIVINGCTKTSIPIEPQENKTREEKILPKETPATSPIKLDLSISPINEEKFAEVNLTIKSERNIQDASGKIILPEAYELVEGTLEWKTDLEKDKLEVFKLKVKSVKEGNWIIRAYAENSSASAELPTKIEPSRGININESEFYKNKKRTFEVGLSSHSFVPEPRKGQDSINYFKSLNLTDDYIYGMIQFETLDGDPTREQMDILASDNITLFEYHGDHTYYARVPRGILENKSYDFVRWTGTVENASWKVVSRLRDQICDNCNGTIKLSIIFYENIENMPDYKTKIDAISNLSKNVIAKGREIIDIETSMNNTYKIASYNFVAKIEPVEIYRLA